MAVFSGYPIPAVSFSYITTFYRAIATLAGNYTLGDVIRQVAQVNNNTGALTLFRWGGMAGIDPATLPAYTAFAERVAAQAPVAAALQREGLQVHTYKPA